MRYGKIGEFFKLDAATGFAYGWAIVCTKGGQPYVDLQGDHIPEDVMIAAAADFMASSRVGKDMHAGDQVGDITFAFPVTKDNRSGLGITGDQTGLMIAFKPDAATAELIKNGDRSGFSIGGWIDDADIHDNIGQMGKSMPAPGAGGRAIYEQNRKAWRSSVAKRTNDLAIGKAVRVFRAFKIREISTVDVPAQEHAKISLYKRGIGKILGKTLVFTTKGAIFTSEVDGHQHVVDFCDVDESGVGTTSVASINTDDYGHWHSFIRDPKTGTIEISANEGHTHTVDPEDVAGAMSAPDLNAPVDGADAIVIEMRAPSAVAAAALTKAAIKMLPTRNPPNSVDKSHKEHAVDPKDLEIADLKKKLSAAIALAMLSDTHKAYAVKLPEHERDGFISKSIVDREATIGAARGAEIYKSVRLGRTFYSTDGDLAIIAKDADAQHDAFQKMTLVAEDATFAKLAGDTIKNFAGDDACHIFIVKAIKKSGGTEKEIADAIASLAGSNATIKSGEGFRGQSPNGDPASGSDAPPTGAEGDLRKAVETYQKAHNIAVYEVAFSKATASDPTVRKLYDDVQNERAIAKRNGNGPKT